MKRTILFATLFSLSAAIAFVGTAKQARAATLSDCASLTKWFTSQVPVKALLSPSAAKAPAPLHLDEDWVIPFSEIGMSGYSCSSAAPPFGAESSGMYDPSLRVAMVSNDGPGSVEGNTLFVVSAPPSGLPQKPVGSVRTKHGLKLGMSLQQVESIEGNGAHGAGPNGSTIVRYAWFVASGPGSPANNQMNLLFKNGSLAAIYIYSAG
jgi:hypothetical protein